jgi:hypothetical protein
LEHLTDDRAQQVPSPADGRLAAPENPAGESLRDISAHQHDHHRDRVQESTAGGFFAFSLVSDMVSA